MNLNGPLKIGFLSESTLKNSKKKIQKKNFSFCCHFPLFYCYGLNHKKLKFRKRIPVDQKVEILSVGVALAVHVLVHSLCFHRIFFSEKKFAMEKIFVKNDLFSCVWLRL